MHNIDQMFLRLKKMDKPEKVVSLVQQDIKTNSPVIIFWYEEIKKSKINSIFSLSNITVQ